jgi:hypothetical protein
VTEFLILVSALENRKQLEEWISEETSEYEDIREKYGNLDFTNLLELVAKCEEIPSIALAYALKI